MAGLVLPIGIVRLKSDFYVIVNPSMMEYPRSKKAKALEKIESKFSSLCNELWGEGTALKTIKFQQIGTDIKNELEKFERQIAIYDASCNEKNLNNEIDFHEEGESKMLSMGLPVCYAFAEKKVTDDVSFIMTADQFKEKFIPKLNKLYPVGFTSFYTLSEEEVIMKISKLICCELKK